MNSAIWRCISSSFSRVIDFKGMILGLQRIWRVRGLSLVVGTEGAYSDCKSQALAICPPSSLFLSLPLPSGDLAYLARFVLLRENQSRLWQDFLNHRLTLRSGRRPSGKERAPRQFRCVIRATPSLMFCRTKSRGVHLKDGVFAFAFLLPFPQPLVGRGGPRPRSRDAWSLELRRRPRPSHESPPPLLTWLPLLLMAVLLPPFPHLAMFDFKKLGN